MSVSAEHLFAIVNTLILPAWLMLMFAPQWRWTKTIVLSGCYALVFSTIYFLLIVLNFDLNNFNFNSLENVKHVFANDYFLLAGWVHYLAFDLLIGSWLIMDSQKNNIYSKKLIPILLFTFYLGPIGYLFYRIYKFILRKS